MRTKMLKAVIRELEAKEAKAQLKRKKENAKG